MTVAAMECVEVWRQVSNYLDGDIDVELRTRVETHIRACARCAAVLNGARNIVQLAGDPRAFPVPANLSKRLYSKLTRHLEGQTATHIPLGITGDLVPLGSHLIYFWESDEEFARGVRFLQPGLEANEHGIIFGHDEALARVFGALRASGHDPDRLTRERRLTVLRRHQNADATLSDIAAVVAAAQRAGVTAVRFLGNLGLERDPLPAGEDDVLHLENSVTALIGSLPCVVVCMYDIRTLPGRMIMKGGLQSHRLAICGDAVCESPFYRPGHASWAHLGQVQ